MVVRIGNGKTGIVIHFTVGLETIIISVNLGNTVCQKCMIFDIIIVIFCKGPAIICQLNDSAIHLAEINFLINGNSGVGNETRSIPKVVCCKIVKLSVNCLEATAGFKIISKIKNLIIQSWFNSSFFC